MFNKKKKEYIKSSEKFTLLLEKNIINTLVNSQNQITGKLLNGDFRKEKKYT